MKAVQLLVNSHLPPELRDYHRQLDARSIGKLMARVAEDSPDEYERVSKAVSDIGRNASYDQGETLHLGDLLPVLDRDKLLDEMRAEIKQVKRDDPKNFERNRLKIWEKYSAMMQKETMRAGLEQGNNLAYSVASGARGKPPQLQAMISSPGLYADYKDQVIPMFVTRSFADGLRPAEFLAGAYGARKAVISTKNCCFIRELVRMADGSKRAIEDVKVGDMIVGADRNGVTFPVRVVRTIRQGKQDVWKYSFKFSNSTDVTHTLLCTEDHKVLMTDMSAFTRGWSRFWRKGGEKPDPMLQHCKAILPAARLGVNKRAAVLPVGGAWDGGKHEPYAQLIGLVLGDGCTRQQGLMLSCADDKMISDIVPYLDTLHLKIRKCSDENYSWAITSKDYTPEMNGSIEKGHAGFVKGARVKHNRVLEDYGMRWKYAWEKTLPEDLWNWDDYSVKQLIAAYFACDGSVHRTAQAGGRLQTSVSFASTSEVLLNDVKELLSVRFGIQSGKVSSTDKGGFGSSTSERAHTLYYFTIGSVTAVKSFAQAFASHVPGIKRERLRAMADEATLKQNNPFSKLALSHKEFVGSLECCDLEVDSEDHLFVLANGIIISNSTARGGDYSKQHSQNAASLIVTNKDCGTDLGILLPSSDPSMRGRILAKNAGDVSAGTMIDKRVLKHLADKGVKNVVVRSAMTCGNHEGLCAKCVGGWFNGGKLPNIGDAVGMTAAAAAGEPVTQMALNQKHTGGQSGGKHEYSGFDVINQIAQSPETFPDRAAVSEVDGHVESIEEAPQGGKYVTVGGERHYVPVGYEIMVREGDKLEAGDQISDGIIDPGDIVRLRGLGEGRRFYAERLKKAMDDSGMPTSLRNTEILARAAIDHVVIDDPDGVDHYLPDDVVSYNTLQKQYTPPANTRPLKTKDAVGKYLQAPVLHYTIGTRVTPKIMQSMTDAGYADVRVTDEHPGFRPEMTRLRTASHSNTDWLASMNTSYLKSQLSDAATRGDTTDVKENIHFAPRLAIGTGFGKNVGQTGKF